MALWNLKKLDLPAMSSCKLTLKELDIKLLDATLKDSITFFNSQQLFSMEAAVLSRMAYKMKMKFRNSKDFKVLEKLNRALHSYLHVNIVQILEQLHGLVPKNFQPNKIYFLTKNKMDFMLVRLQGLGKILCRILETCKIVAILMQQRLRLGHFWKIGIIAFAISARIFVIVIKVLKHVCDLYGSLLPYSKSLDNSKVKWLPDDYHFPEKLDEWLNVDWLDLDKTVIEILDDEEDSVFSYMNLAESDDDVEFCDEYIVLDDDSFFGMKSSQKSEVGVKQQITEVENVVEKKEEVEVDVGENINISSDDEVEFVRTVKGKGKNAKGKKGMKRKRDVESNNIKRNSPIKLNRNNIKKRKRFQRNRLSSK